MVALAVSLPAVAGTARAQDAGVPADAGAPSPDAAIPEEPAAAGTSDGDEAAADLAAPVAAAPPEARGPSSEAPPAAPPPTAAPAAPPPATARQAPPALARPPAQPVRHALRPLALPAGTARIDAAFQITSQDRDALGRQSYVSFLGVIGYGVTDDLELGAIALPLQVSPEGHFGDPGAYALYRFVEGDVEAGGWIEARVPVREESAFTAGASARLLVRASESVRIDGGVSYLVAFRDPEEAMQLGFPVSVAFHSSETFFLGVSTGFDLENFHDSDRANAYIPAGVFLGGTLRGDGGPSGDLRLGWFLPSATDGTRLWVLGFGGSFFIY